MEEQDIKRTTDYGVQLLAKQKLREYYGDVSEKQFRGLYQEATRRKVIQLKI